MTTERSMTRMEANRTAILERAIEVFAEEGFRDADVQKIAEKAGVGYGTVYRYFCTKEQLFWTATYVVLERLGAQVRESVNGCDGAIEALRAAGLAYASFLEAHPEYLAVFVESRAEFRGRIPPLHREFHHNLVQLLVEILERSIAKKEIRPLDARGVVISLGSILYGVTMFGCYVQDQYTICELAEQTLDVFLGGIKATNSLENRHSSHCDSED